MSEDRVIGLLGLSRKAGKTASGDFLVTEALQAHKAHVILLSADASENTRKRFHDKGAFYHVDVFDLPYTKAQLGHAMGQEDRSVACVLDEGLAGLIRSAIAKANS